MFVGRGVGSVPTDDTTANTAGCLANAQPTTAGSIVRVTVTNPVWHGVITVSPNIGISPITEPVGPTHSIVPPGSPNEGKTKTSIIIVLHEYQSNILFCILVTTYERRTSLNKSEV